MALLEPWLRAGAAKGGRGEPEVGHLKGAGVSPRGWGSQGLGEAAVRISEGYGCP